MEIDKLIKMIEYTPTNQIARGTVINYIADNTDDWIMVLKALLIKNPSRGISKSYLLKKLKYMKRHPNQAWTFLDHEGMSIFTILRQV